jgi:thymidylate synthase (FAD)
MEFKTVSPNVELVAITTPVSTEYGFNAQDLISYCARVSNPANQANFDTATGLLKYCRRNQHWSVFEMTSMVLKIVTTRDIGRQILRHRSFHFQEFSQRYAQVMEVMDREVRMQDSKNRQNSLECIDEGLKSWWKSIEKQIRATIGDMYTWALDEGIAKEVSRSLLPEGEIATTMFMHGTIRDWYHYCNIRTQPETQKEHREIASMCQDILYENFPALKPSAAEISTSEQIIEVLVANGLALRQAQTLASQIQHKLSQ